MTDPWQGLFRWKWMGQRPAKIWFRARQRNPVALAIWGISSQHPSGGSLQPATFIFRSSEIHDGCEAYGIEAGAADEESIGLRLGHKSLRSVGIDAAAVAVQDTNIAGLLRSKASAHLSADESVSRGGSLGRSGLA